MESSSDLPPPVMAHLAATVTARVDSPPAVVYGLFVDYHVKHPLILPPDHLSNLVIEEGGVGAGTVFRVDTHALGQTRRLRMAVSEPEPGRVLVERELPEGAPGAVTTTFRVEPVGAGSSVTISSAWEKRGVAAFVDRWVAVPLMRRIYAKELALVAEVARREVATASTARPRASVRP